MDICEGKELDLIANSPQTGLVLVAEAENFAFVNIEMEGDRGQMTNQDLGTGFLSKATYLFIKPQPKV